MRTCHVHNPNYDLRPSYNSATTGPTVLKFGTYIEAYQLRGLHQSKVGQVRTCARATCTNPPESSCYISKTTGPIVLKFGTYAETHRLSDLQ